MVRAGWRSVASVVAARSSVIVILVVVCKGVLLTNGAQVISAGNDRRVGGYTTQSPSGGVVATVGIAVVCRCTAQRGTKSIASGRAGHIGGRGTAARGQLGDGHARRRRLRLLFDGVKALCVSVGCVRARARGAAGSCLSARCVRVWSECSTIRVCLPDWPLALDIDQDLPPGMPTGPVPDRPQPP